jgi:hypothetical protein
MKMDSAIFLLAATLIKQPEGKGQTKHPSGPCMMTVNNPENIRKSILDFTAPFGEINPDMLYLCRRGLSGLERAVFASFPSIRRAPMKKIVKSSIFCEKTSKFLRFLSFKT